MTLAAAAAALRARQVSSAELTENCLREIDRRNTTLNAFLTVTREEALRDARQADEDLHHGRDLGPLHGIPIAHKDLLCTDGIRTTSGSKIFASFVPNFDATAVARLRAAGAVSLGKTHLHEHACGITCDNPHYGPIRNPWDEARIPGGSSGGSAVAVSTSMAFAATGSDTGGSIRIPASYCGLVGFKPTFGLVSKYGALPLAFSLDHVGPITRTVDDAAIMMDALAGHDPKDPSSVNRPLTSFRPGAGASLKGVRIILPRNFFFDRTDPEVRRVVLAAAESAERAGAVFHMVPVPDPEQLNAIAHVTFIAEAAAAHEPYLRKRRSDYGADVLAILDMAAGIPASAYVQAQRLRRRFIESWDHLLAKADCVLTPATPIVAPLIGQTTLDIAGKPEDVRLASTSLVRGINAIGFPALAIPAGLTSTGLPVGLQLIGRPFADAALLQIGAAFESTIAFHPA